MSKPNGTFLGYKVCRRKFLVTSTVVILLFLVVFTACLYFFTTIWKNEHYASARNDFSSIERRIGGMKEQLNEFVDEMYASRRIIMDTKSLYQAKGEAEYIKNRETDSKSTATQIAYLPSEMKRLFLSSRIGLRGITLSSEEGVKAIWLDRASGDMRITFGLEKETDAQKKIEGFGDLALLHLNIRNPESIIKTMGSITFWTDTESVFYQEASEGNECIIVKNQDVLLSKMPPDIEARILEASLMIKTSLGDYGTFRRGLFDDIYYMKNNFTQYDATYISAVSLKSLWKENAKIIFVLFTALGGVAAGAILSAYAGVREDSRFLSCIMKMFSAMENGDFSVAEGMQGDWPKSRNEYGVIASDLKEVSRKLDGYIRTEYIFKLKQQETAMRALQQQIDPHFLYNTLETIRSKALVREDVETAAAIEHLGSLFRARVHSADVISLKEEFELLQMYLHIMELRFAEKFVYRMVLDEDVECVNTINFWMQPLAENFFTHGFEQESEFNLLLIEGHKEKNCVVIDMIDNGKGMTQQRLESVKKHMYEGSDNPNADIGIRNVYMRLSWYYGKKFQMNIMHAQECGTHLQIRIPLDGQAQNEDIIIEE